MNSTWVSYPCLYWKTNEDLHFFLLYINPSLLLCEELLPNMILKILWSHQQLLFYWTWRSKGYCATQALCLQINLSWVNLAELSLPVLGGNHVTLRISQGLGACFTSSFSSFLFYKICVHSLFTVCSEKKSHELMLVKHSEQGLSPC